MRGIRFSILFIGKSENVKEGETFQSWEKIENFKI